MNVTEQVIKIGIGIIELAKEIKQSSANKMVRREIRRLVSKAIQIRQFEEAANDMTKALEPFFKRQIESAVKELRSIETRSFSSKDFSDAALVLANTIFNPKDWDEELVDITLPLLAKAIAESIIVNLMTIGLDVRKKTKVEIKQVKQSTASEWLDNSDEELPESLIFTTPAGPVRIGIATEFPLWMRVAIAKQLKETFSEPYWEEVNLTTRNDIARILEDGLQNGLSIRAMAKKMTRELGSEYDKIRATRVARTESGNALNAGRDIGINRLKEELGPEAGQHIGKEWLSVLGPTTRDSHAGLDGVLSDENGMFNLDGVLIPWPSHQSLPPENRLNCQCTILTAFGINAPEDEILSLIEAL